MAGMMMNISPFLMRRGRIVAISKICLQMSTSKRVLVPLADGTEEIEATTITDTLVRAGAQVTTASVGSQLLVTCSRGIKITADCMIGECVGLDWDLIVCPGGMPGAEHLRDSSTLRELLVLQSAEGKLVGAICAAPAVVLATHGLINGRSATCYPAPKFKDVLSNYKTDAVVVDGTLITSQGPGTSLLFALKLVEVLFGEDMASKLSKEMLIQP